MKFKALFVAGATLVTACLSLASQSIVGKWQGHFDFDFSKMPKAQNAQQQARLDQMKETFKNLHFLLQVAPGKTYSITYSGAGSAKSHTAAGSWTQNGNTIKLTPTTIDGKPAPGNKGAQTQTFTLSSNGKTLKLVPPPGAKGGNLIFTR